MLIFDPAESNKCFIVHQLSEKKRKYSHNYKEAMLLLYFIIIIIITALYFRTPIDIYFL